MNDKPKYVIEKNVPLPEPRATKIYEYYDIPFDQMEVGDCVSIPFKTLILIIHTLTQKKGKAQ
jgi:hypothetical protein